jgi:hypothetical protein
MDIMEKECDTSLQRLNNDSKPVFSIGSNVDQFFQKNQPKLESNQ